MGTPNFGNPQISGSRHLEGADGVAGEVECAQAREPRDLFEEVLIAWGF